MAWQNTTKEEERNLVKIQIETPNTNIPKRNVKSNKSTIVQHSMENSEKETKPLQPGKKVWDFDKIQTLPN